MEYAGDGEPPPGHWAASTFQKKFPERKAHEPYVVVIHKKTGNNFVLDGVYNLLPDSLTEKDIEYIRSYHVEYWDEWVPTQDEQRPWWAKNKPAEEFEAFWIAQ